MRTYHFICEVRDSINNKKLIGSTYCNASTPLKAEKYFRKDKFISRHLGNERYHITMRQNAILLQDSYDYYQNWKNKK